MAGNNSIRYEDIPEALVNILERRGLEGKNQVEGFLYPHLSDLPSPFLMKGMEEAVKCIVAALDTNRNIVLWGDYDVDGTTGIALLISFFRCLGKEVYWHVPDRLTEGYGLNIQNLRKIGETINDFSYLLITVDCGIANSSEIVELQRWGAAAIITDHHRISSDSLPPCIVINPNQPDCGFCGEHLAGVGVAFYLAAGLRSFLREHGYFENQAVPNLKHFLSFAALGSIADMVPLRRSNRVLVRAGLEVLGKTEFPGLRSLLETSGIADGKIFADDVGFQLGPKLNAAGRMANAKLAVELLTCRGELEAKKMARKLDQLNTLRKSTCEKDLEKALALIDQFEVESTRCCIVNGDFHHGILGILASRLMELFKTPTIVLSAIDIDGGDCGDNKVLKGSCRSPEHIDITNILHFCKDLLESYGGHKAAAGLSLKEGNLKEFKNKVYLAVKSSPVEKSITEVVPEDEISIQEIFSPSYLNILSLCEPFGQGNERPIFVDKEAVIIDVRQVGSRKEHLQISFRTNGRPCKGIGFHLGDKIKIAREGRGCEVVYSLAPNRFNGNLRWQVLVLDLKIPNH
ncbi:single-stranded-DNA-specific exonuclease RecJ [Desulfoprunum benzoelyticum]|uniref:Single-stranded-DNA-specific exonuclease RecJ n=1 Tax=Desulfoprunum benzoelyticum TaxID=1506996 RepID=A0A840UYI5_9BACT|nr:single-stranded-DNA-specific exonuclease RecJ [Desulfoprunum benzoelyticum]MBB5346509.1 single-stranded-DNA-specific exonuclease [Desulfoprunum benzoelyticum]MBM9528962.1 single-stranded-DNA-specific exonuclease RecJ [Desulfoprunum benzoelyticum]